MRLNIIGNGFDMYHGLPCSYYYFGCYLLQHHTDFYEELAKMYDFSYALQTDSEDFEYGVEKIFWRYFEEKLGTLNPTWIQETLEDDLGLECSDPVDIDIPETANSEVIKKYFQEWVSSTLDTDENFNTVKEHLAKNKLKWTKEDYFINYNYSHTLEKVYHIPSHKIFHIHGECGEDSELIVGHGNNSDITKHSEMLKSMKNSSAYYGYQSSRNRYNEYRCELAILEDLKKDIPRLIDNMKFQLSYWNKEVSEIYVWGLSCGPVDMPYIKKLNELFPSVHWSFSYYEDLEKIARKELTNQLGITNVNYFELNNRDSKTIEKLLVLENDIQEVDCI